MTKPKVYVSRILAPEGLRELRDVCDLHIWQKSELMPREVQLKLFADCTGLLATTDIKINRELLEACPDLKVVSNHAVGFDNIDVPTCTDFGVPAGNTPGVLSETTADLAFTLILATARRVLELADWVKQDRWTANVGMLDNLGRDVHHTTLGILGLGRIGREVARRATGFNMKILYHNRKRDEQTEKEFGAKYATRDEILNQSDIVSLHLPLSGQTTHYIGKNELKQMKPSAILVNTARGQIVDQAALYNAIKNGTIAGAGLDVTDPEPMRGNDPLLTLPQVTILPHIGSATDATRIKMAEMASRNLIRALNGQPMLSCINPESIGKGRSASLYHSLSP
jgi:glyoxylate reductase